ncbi:MAG TPA: hypothetical protein VGZ89_05695 [Xanthobacteraceae bacterium]|jgi:hypothetical protein|nr:hypothetical protein [Xanthobacteraceae bacterium]
MDDDTAILEREAQHRIDQVRLRQMAYQVHKAYPKLPPADVEPVAMVLMGLFDEGKKPTWDDLRARVEKQFDPDYAKHLLAAIIGSS